MESQPKFINSSKNLTKSAMILADNLFFYKATTLKDVYKSVYGYGFFYFSLSEKRYEKRKILMSSELNKLITIKMIRSFIPYNRTIYKRYQVHLYILYILKTYKSARHILGLPVRGQRTWSNANTQKRVNIDLKKIFSIKAWKKYPFLTKTYSNIAAMAEFGNYMFKNNWTKEWMTAESQINAIKSSKNIVKIDLYAMSRFFMRIDKGDYKVSKKTKQKRKVVKQLGFTTGLRVGFAKTYLCKSARELRHVFMQFYYTKTTRMIVEKDKKKKKKKNLGKGVKSMKVARKMRKKKKKTLWD